MLIPKAHCLLPLGQIVFSRRPEPIITLSSDAPDVEMME